ncbi:MAG: NAD(+) synthase [Christensenellales bacterium]
MSELRICCADVGGRPGDVRAKRDEILRRLRGAQRSKTDLLLLPPLCLSGAGCGDLFFQETLLAACRRAAGELARLSRDTALIFGLPLRHAGRLYAVSAIAWGGRLRGLVPKTSLSAAERRWFSSWEGEAGRLRLAGSTLPIGPDLLFTLPGGTRLGLLPCAAEEAVGLCGPLLKHGAELLAIQGQEPTLAGEGYRRREWLRQLSLRVPCLYQNAGAGESTTDLVFGGESLIAAGGEILLEGLPFARLPLISSCLHPGAAEPPVPAFDLTPRDRIISDAPYAPPEGFLRRLWAQEAIEIAAQGLARRMAHIGAKTAVLGLSGGLDSAMALIISARALDILGLPREALLAFSLPCFGTGGRTRRNALALMGALHLEQREIDIAPSVRLHLEAIGHEGEIDAAYENAQARERTQVLMDIANMQGGLMVGTGDMSELALGFTTFGGDHLSMYAVNGGLYKSAIRLILQEVAETGGEPLRGVLEDILATPISPELRPEGGQHTEAIVGPYELCDFYLYYALSEGYGPETLLRYAKAAFGTRYARQELLHWMRLFFQRFFSAQFKRSCLSDGPQVLGLSLSPRGGFSLPSDASPALWLSRIDALAGQGDEA